MKQNYVLQLKADMEFMDFFMVKTIAIRVGSNRKKYLDMTLADCTGEISAKKWDISDEDKMYIQNKIMEYCLAYGYLYNGSYFYFE